VPLNAQTAWSAAGSQPYNCEITGFRLQATTLLLFPDQSSLD